MSCLPPLFLLLSWLSSFHCYHDQTAVFATDHSISYEHNFLDANRRQGCRCSPGWRLSQSCRWSCRRCLRLGPSRNCNCSCFRSCHTFLVEHICKQKITPRPPCTQMVKQKRCSHPQGDGMKKGVYSLYNLIQTHLKFYLRMTTQMLEATFAWAPAAGVIGSRSRILDFLGNLAMLLQVP